MSSSCPVRYSYSSSSPEEIETKIHKLEAALAAAKKIDDALPKNIRSNLELSADPDVISLKSFFEDMKIAFHAMFRTDHKTELNNPSNWIEFLLIEASYTKNDVVISTVKNIENAIVSAAHNVEPSVWSNIIEMTALSMVRHGSMLHENPLLWSYVLTDNISSLISQTRRGYPPGWL